MITVERFIIARRTKDGLSIHYKSFRNFNDAVNLALKYKENLNTLDCEVLPINITIEDDELRKEK